MKKLAPDLSDFHNRIKKLNLSGNHLLAKKETERFTLFKKENGLSGGMNTLKILLNVFQGFIFLVWACLMQKYTYKLEDYPQMITGGFLWFKDLTLTDPYFILPMLNVVGVFFLILCNNQAPPNQVMVKARKMMLIFPFLSFPLLSCLQSGMMLYLCTMTGLNALFYVVTKTRYFRELNNIDNVSRNFLLYKVVSYLYF